MSRYAEFNNERTYGIEIEFLPSSHSREAIAQELRNAGINAYSESYNHTTKSNWKLITDASCGNELVSPVLKGHEGLEEIKKVCAVLNRLGCRVNKSCGLHVHHYAGDLTVKNFRNLYISYAKYEGLIDTLHPVSRRGNNNRYCRSLITYGYDNLVARLDKCKTIDDIRGIFGTRYMKLNIESYVKYGTIEFRQAAGTTDADKIINWIMFTQLMVERSKFSIVAKIEREYNHLGCLYNMLGIVRRATCSDEMFEMGKYFRDRAKKLRSAA
mgnify:FL=1